MQRHLTSIMCSLLFLLLVSCVAKDNSSYAVDTTQNNAIESNDDKTLVGGENKPDVSMLFETTSKINDDVPDLIFRGMGYKEDSNSFLDVIIVNSKTYDVINNIHLPDYTLGGGPIISDALNIEFIDINFDGFKDIVIFDCPDGNFNIHYVYFTWDTSAGIFIADTGLADPGLPKFDEEKQLIFSMQRGSATDHIYYAHKYIDGVLTVVEEISDSAVHFKQDVTNERLVSIAPILLEYPTGRFQYCVVKRMNYDKFALEVIESKYQLYTPNDWTLIEEYDADSEIGMHLTELVDWDLISLYLVSKLHV